MINSPVVEGCGKLVGLREAGDEAASQHGASGQKRSDQELTSLAAMSRLSDEEVLGALPQRAKDSASDTLAFLESTRSLSAGRIHLFQPMDHAWRILHTLLKIPC